MREIKFRGLVLGNEYWVYGSLLSYDPIPEIQSTTLEENDYDYASNEVIPETVGQFVGIKDKNGADVYDGDLISFYGSKYLKHIAYSKDGRLVWKTKNGDFSVNVVEIHDPFQYEVIGNIHENTELLHQPKVN